MLVAICSQHTYPPARALLVQCSHEIKLTSKAHIPDTGSLLYFQTIIKLVCVPVERLNVQGAISQAIQPRPIRKHYQELPSLRILAEET